MGLKDEVTKRFHPSVHFGSALIAQKCFGDESDSASQREILIETTIAIGKTLIRFSATVKWDGIAFTDLQLNRGEFATMAAGPV